MATYIYSNILAGMQRGKKQFALLIDPDKHTVKSLEQIVKLAADAGVHFIFVGGSLLMNDLTRKTVKVIKELTEIPVMLFPGSTMQFCDEADALLFLSLISGRNPDYLIGRHVEIAPVLKRCKVEVLPTGYIIIDTGKPTTVNYMSNTMPIPYDKKDIAACTAMAGELLGQKLIFLEGGSGASKPVSAEMIEAVKSSISIPLIVGGGITTKEMASEAYSAGADIVVVGNALEKNPRLIGDFSGVFEK